MGYKGIVRGNVIELDESLPFPEGTRVDVAVAPEPTPRKNSPQAWLQLAGTLTEEEGEASLRFIREHVRRVDWEMWKQRQE